ncbi:MAG: hypothetical protein SCALA702_29780 [Melioribacteraceae bacterium]|nr:MAG: hypothetical protein SCALA702_29780 [Melioribacteraceae bacterium]
MKLYIFFLLGCLSSLNAQWNYENFDIDYTMYSVNDIYFNVSNLGEGSPGNLFGMNKEPGATLLYSYDLNWITNYREEVKHNGNRSESEFYVRNYIPGFIDEYGQIVEPDDPKSKIFAISNDGHNLSYNEYLEQIRNYPTEAGAPWSDRNKNGVFDPELDSPVFYGDKMLWFARHNFFNLSTFTGIPIELKTKIFGFGNNPFLKNVIFIEYTLENKSDDPMLDFYPAFKFDPDLGRPYDDAFGCDSTLNLGFIYNKKSEDFEWGDYTPVMGIQLLDAPQNKNGESSKLSSMVYSEYSYRNSSLLEKIITIKQNLFRGLKDDGSPFINPQTGEPTKFLFHGNPYKGTGWNYTYVDSTFDEDIKLQMNCGPFDIYPRQSIKLLYALMLIDTDDINLSIQNIINIAGMLKDSYRSLLEPQTIDTYEEEKTEYFYISDNYPNPFNGTTNIKYIVKHESTIKVEVFNSLGQKIDTLLDEEKQPGIYFLSFNAAGLSSGTYFLRFDMGWFSEMIKMAYVK